MRLVVDTVGGVDHGDERASGSGIGAVTFDFEANPSATPRTGSVSIGGQAVTITQGGSSGGGPVPPPPANLHIVR